MEQSGQSAVRTGEVFWKERKRKKAKENVSMCARQGVQGVAGRISMTERELDEARRSARAIGIVAAS